MDKNGEVRDMVDGMCDADAKVMKGIYEDIRAAIARVPGKDQEESRLRAFTLIATTCTAMVGEPVVVTWCDAPGGILQCTADGKVKRMFTDATAMDVAKH